MADVRFINCETKSVFDSKLTSGEIVSGDIVFIADKKTLWTHGISYHCPYSKEEIDALVQGGSTEEIISSLVKTDELTFTGDAPEVNLGSGDTLTFKSSTGSVVTLDGANITGNAATATTAQTAEVANGLSSDLLDDLVLVDGSNAMTGALVAKGGVKLGEGASLYVTKDGNYEEVLGADENGTYLKSGYNSIVLDSETTNAERLLIKSPGLSVIPDEEHLNAKDVLKFDWGGTIPISANFGSISDEGAIRLGLGENNPDWDIILTNSLGKFGVYTQKYTYEGEEKVGVELLTLSDYRTVINSNNIILNGDAVIPHISADEGNTIIYVALDPNRYTGGFLDFDFEESAWYTSTNSSKDLSIKGSPIATQGWVSQQNYLTSTSLTGYLPLSGGALTGELSTPGTLKIHGFEGQIVIQDNEDINNTATRTIINPIGIFKNCKSPTLSSEAEMFIIGSWCGVDDLTGLMSPSYTHMVLMEFSVWNNNIAVHDGTAHASKNDAFNIGGLDLAISGSYQSGAVFQHSGNVLNITGYTDNYGTSTDSDLNLTLNGKKVAVEGDYIKPGTNDLGETTLSITTPEFKVNDYSVDYHQVVVNTTAVSSPNRYICTSASSLDVAKDGEYEFLFPTEVDFIFNGPIYEVNNIKSYEPGTFTGVQGYLKVWVNDGKIYLIDDIKFKYTTYVQAN